MQGDTGDGLGAIELVARDSLALVLDDVAPDDIGPDHDMVREYGLTSLNKVLFMTDVCERTGVSVANFTEQDVAAMRTLHDVVTALARHANLVGAERPMGAGAERPIGAGEGTTR